MSLVEQSAPPLVAGECLTRDEFIRRWEALPDLKFAELIDGVVHLSSPLSPAHATGDSLLSLWLAFYALHTPGCKSFNNMTWLMRNASPQPDLSLCVLPAHGGQSRLEGKLFAGAPELAVEVCHITIDKDLGSKLRLYEREGVREYVVLVIDRDELLWHNLVDGRFVVRSPDPDGILRSRVFPGLWLDASAVLADDGRRVMAVLQQGLSTPDHAAFAAQLLSRRRG